MAAIGIDLGTTYSCVAVVVDGKVEILPNRRGNYTTPSCVAFTEQGALVGEDAKNNLAEDPENTIYNIKRVIGLHSDEPVFMDEKRKLPYNLVERDEQIHVKVCVNGQVEHYLPEEISGKVLSEMKQLAEDYLGETVVNAVITVPARFNNSQRKKTREAAAYAKLNVLQLLHEPTAAAIAYGLQYEEKRDGRNVLVYDLGGGTFDVTILKITEDTFEIAATAGDTHLGGEDFDELMVAECTHDFARNHGVNLSEDVKTKFRLRRACEKTKIALSTVLEDKVEVENLHDGKDYTKRFRRAKFESINEDYFEATMESVGQALRDAKLSKEQIDDIVIVGGSSRIPIVQTMLRKYFKKQVCKSLNPDQAVAFGAAICAAKHCGDVTAEMRHFHIKDVIPLSLGVETKGGVMSVIIKRNTEFPTKQHGFYTTADDYQTSIRFSIFEGERAKVALNHLLGSFNINEIQSQLAGLPNIRVAFEIDIDGMLNVTAVDTGTGNESGTVIEWEKRSKPKDQAKLEVAKAEQYKQQDEEWRASALARNKLEAEAKRIKRIARDKFALWNDLHDDADITEICEDVLEWLRINPDATAVECRIQEEKFEEYRYI